MSRFNPHHDLQKLFDVVSIWKENCLKNNGSLFSSGKVWSKENVQQLVIFFVNSPDESDLNFIEKLKNQLFNANPEAKKLAAEILYVMLLCQSNTYAARKRAVVKTIWDWSGESLDEAHPLLQDAVIDGVGSGGTGFNTNRWREFRFAILFLEAFFKLDPQAKLELLMEGWKFGEWLEGIPECDSRQFRHMLLFMLFPDQFERIFGGTDRAEVVLAFTGESKKQVARYSALEIDKKLFKIREQESVKYSTQELDFYIPPLKGIWQKHVPKDWLFAWNPTYWEWKDLPDAISAIEAGGSCMLRWRCANSNVRVGDRAWLVRLGVAPKGIMAVGNVVSEPYESPHFNEQKAEEGISSLCVDIEFSKILDVYKNAFVDEKDLKNINVDSQNWFPQSSGIEIKPRSAAILDKLWKSLLSQENDKPKLTGAQMIHQNPVNLIMFGPPGTGKTRELNSLTEKYMLSAKPISREQWLAEQLIDDPWFDVVFMALHLLGGKAKVNDITNHEFVVQKAKAVGRTANIKQQIWASLQMHTPESSTTVNYAKRYAPFVFDKSENSVWSLIGYWQDECEEQIQRAEFLKSGKDSTKSIQRYEFVTFHQAYSYEDFVEGIRPVQDPETREPAYRVMPGVFKRICEKARLDPQNRYAIFIDEINRGNIAKIFGELITLIEIDKRGHFDTSGEQIKGMSLTLPYSGDKFSVPSNLDIYGTMNTADRSIALLDTALRRRFHFKELMPNSAAISGPRGDGYIEDGEGGVINLRALLDAMNRRVRFLLSRDLMLGHAYFCKIRDFSDLKEVLLNQIIPLLQEYFYSDWHKIQLVFRDIGDGDKAIHPQIVIHEVISEVDVLGFDHDDYDDMIDYRIAKHDEITPESIRKIYESAN